MVDARSKDVVVRDFAGRCALVTMLPLGVFGGQSGRARGAPAPNGSKGRKRRATLFVALKTLRNRENVSDSPPTR
jgi:hypothetical protein